MKSKLDFVNIIDKAILISILTFGGYLLTYSFMVGFNVYLHIPNYLIDINLTSLLFSVVTLSIILYYFFVFFIFTNKYIISTILYLFYLIMSWVISGTEWFCIISLTLTYILSIVIFKLYDKKIIKINQKIRFFEILNKLPFAHTYIKIIVYFILIFWISYDAGGLYAFILNNKSIIQITNINEKYVVVNQYKNYFICKKYDETTKRFDTNKTMLIPIDNSIIERIDKNKLK